LSPPGYAGHMARTERALARWLAEVDLVWEVADARCPRASRHPRLAALCAARPRVLVLAHADLAEPQHTARWIEKLEAEQPTVAVDLSGDDPAALGRLLRGSRRAVASGGAPGRPRELRALVVGMPNTGKSTLLNRLAGRRRLAVADRPGVTRGPQWLHVEGLGRLLDLPGVLPPRLGLWPVAWRQWAVGILPEEAVDAEQAASALGTWLLSVYPQRLTERYGWQGEAGEELLSCVAKRRGRLLAGGRPDLQAAALTLRREWEQGLLGPCSLEHVTRME